ncbi:MAG: serine/threonine-protein kinase, partial [Planctomycetota bacterium]
KLRPSCLIGAMSELQTADNLAQRALDVGVLDERQLQSAWSDLGTNNVTLSEFAKLLVRKGLLTNYQIERLNRDQRSGYFYGDYKVLYLVGAGTFARVFRAVHVKTGKVYAVKVLRTSKSTEPGQADLFRREGELGASLKHKNIVPIHEVVSRGPLNYIVMDFIEGQNLREMFRVRRKFRWDECSQMIGSMLAGLQYAFSQGVTHRDLKMSNVLIASDGEAKLIDFGLAALDNAGDGGVDRTVEYAALEKATGVRKDDTRSDVYFSGYMMHQMLSGETSLPTGKDRSTRFGRDAFKAIRPIKELAPETPMPIAMVVNKALELDPERRYQSPGDMLTELKIAVRRTTSGATDGAQKQELMSREGLDEQGQSRRLMVVESDTKRQDVFRDLFKRNGYRVLVSSDPQRAFARFVDDQSAADIVLFCSGSIGQAAVSFFNQFGDDTMTRKLPCVLLLDEAHGQWLEQAKTSGHRIAVRMPIKLRQLREIVLAALQARPA